MCVQFAQKCFPIFPECVQFTYALIFLFSFIELHLSQLYDYAVQIFLISCLSLTLFTSKYVILYDRTDFALRSRQSMLYRFKQIQDSPMRVAY